MNPTGLTDPAARQSAARAAIAALFAAFPPPPHVQWREQPDGTWCATPPQVTRTGTVVHVHGGGFTLGDPATYGGLLGSLAERLEMPVRSVPYRLAPEHPFPCGLDDVTAGLRPISQTPFSVIADSAGAALAVTALRRIAAETGRRARALVLLSPLLRLDGAGGSYDANADTDRMFSARSLAALRTAYLGTTDPQNPEASPLYAPANDLPPVLLFASTSEVLRDDATAFADAVNTAGGTAHLHLVDNQVHAWPTFQGENPATADVITATATFLADAHSTPLSPEH